MVPEKSRHLLIVTGDSASRLIEKARTRPGKGPGAIGGAGAADRWRAAVAYADDAGLDAALEKLSGLLAGHPQAAGGERDACFSPPRPEGRGRVAFLFPGQGSQQPGMLEELYHLFPGVKNAFENADRALEGPAGGKLSSFVYPVGNADPAAAMQALTRTEIAQPALGAAGLGLHRLLVSLGVSPDAAAGHSAGEYTALAAAGVIDEKDLYPLLARRGEAMAAAAAAAPGTMAAVMGDAATVGKALGDISGLYLANLNSPRQTVISGHRPAIAEALERAGKLKLRARAIPVAGAFHSPLMEPARDAMEKLLSALEFHEPLFPVYANSTAAEYPRRDTEIRSLLAGHLVKPVRFAEEIEALYHAGTRVFVESGPGAVLTNLVGQVLAGREFLAVSPGRAIDGSGLEGLRQAVVRLAAEGFGPENTPRELFASVEKR